MSVNGSSGANVRAKREQVADHLREMALMMSPGERLPSVNDLRKRFGVAAVTVEGAMSLLREVGVVISRPRSGNYVAPREQWRIDADGMSDAAPGGNGHDSVFVFSDVASRAIYSPDVTSQPLAGSVIVLAPSAHAFYFRFVNEITRQAGSFDMTVSCQFGDVERFCEALTSLRSRHIAGIFAIGEELRPYAASLIQNGYRVVLSGTHTSSGGTFIPEVSRNAEHGGYMAITRLLAHGHRSFLYVASDATRVQVMASPAWTGILRGLGENGLAESAIEFFNPKVEGRGQYLPVLAHLLSAGNSPTAIIARPDTAAVEVVAILKEIGIRIPQEMSMIAFGSDSITAALDPPIDTIDPHVEMMVQHAFRLLSSEHGQEGGPPHISVTPSLIARASVARAPYRPADFELSESAQERIRK